MHSLSSRANQLSAFAGTVLLCLVLANYLSVQFNPFNPHVDVKVNSIKAIRKLPQLKNDIAEFTFDLDIDLQSEFTWNTKMIFVFVGVEYETPKNSRNQITLWDRIIQNREDCQFTLKDENLEYYFVDEGHGLVNTEFKLIVQWDIIPIGGLLSIRRAEEVKFKLGETYSSS